jgi:hypothetical protein
LIGSGLSSTCRRSTVSLCSQTPQSFLTIEQRRRLLAARVAAAGLPAFERRDEAQRQRPCVSSNASPCW